MKTTNKYAFTTEFKTNDAQSKLTVLIPVYKLYVISSASAVLKSPVKCTAAQFQITK